MEKIINYFWSVVGFVVGLAIFSIFSIVILRIVLFIPYAIFVEVTGISFNTVFLTMFTEKILWASLWVFMIYWIGMFIYGILSGELLKFVSDDPKAINDSTGE